jgi:hypothetical protein
MKTSKDISIALVLIFLGLALFLPAALSESFLQTIVGKMWMICTFLSVLFGLLKIEQVSISNGTLIKTNFIFRRTIDLKRINRFKIKANDMNTYPQYNIAGILKIFKNGERYSKFRILTLYIDGKRKMKIDERTMTTSDFKKVLSEIKKGQKKAFNIL